MTESGWDRICKIPMDTGRRTTTITATITRIPEAILVEILATFPLRSIARFKTVCKTWKSMIESPYFRRLYLSLHSSSSWSLMFRAEYQFTITEVIGFHGCETWELPNSPGSYILTHLQTYLSKVKYFYRASSNGLVWIEVSTGHKKNKLYEYISFVGNPVLQQWVQLPPLREPSYATGLVTRLDEDGLVSSFKVVRTFQDSDKGMREWNVCVYSSDTGLWSFKRLLCAHSMYYNVTFYAPMNINGMLYLWVRDLSPYEPGVLIAHDFYCPEAGDQCRVIPLPVPYNRFVKRCLTPSGGDVIYIEIIDRRLKVWKLNNIKSSEYWQLSREEIDMVSVGFKFGCIPLAMNPFDSDIVYLYSLEHNCFVSGNLRTNEFIVHKESENWSSSKGCGRIYTQRARAYIEHTRYMFSVVMLSQFVLPRWINPVPLPPFVYNRRHLC